MDIYCCGCKRIIDARLTNGAEIYQKRADLHALPFWKCDICRNYVGCHHKTKNRTNPLGHIPTPEIRKARHSIHGILDPLWKSGKISRKHLYAMISAEIGWDFHTAKLKNIEEARKIYIFVKNINI